MPSATPRRDDPARPFNQPRRRWRISTKPREEKKGVNDRFPAGRALNYQRGCETLAPRKSAKSRGGGKQCRGRLAAIVRNRLSPSSVCPPKTATPWCNGTRRKRIVLPAIVNHGIKSLYTRMPLTRRTLAPERARARAS